MQPGSHPRQRADRRGLLRQRACVNRLLGGFGGLAVGRQYDVGGKHLRRAQPHVDLHDDQQHAHEDEERADRVLDEHQDVAARYQHGAAEILLEARPEHEAKQHRRRMEIEQQQYIADDADDDDLADLEHIVVGAVDADADEEHRARIEIFVRDRQQLHPQADHRDVEHHQDDVADPEARDQAPENIRVLADELRAGHDALYHQRAQDQRHHRVARNAEAHGRDEVALHRGVGRGFRAGDAFDHAGAEQFGRLRNLLFGGVGDERGDGRAGARDERAQAADQCAAEHGRDRAAEFLARGPQVLELDVGIFGVDLGQLIDALHELGDAEQAERQRDDFDAVEQIGNAEGEARRAGFDVAADNADQQAADGHGDALERRTARQRRAGQQAEQHQRAYFRRAEFERHHHQYLSLIYTSDAA